MKKCLRKTGSNMSAPLEKQKHYCCTHCLPIGSKLTKQGYQCHNTRHKIQLSTLQISNYLREYQNEIISLLIKIWAIEASTVCVQMMPFFKVFKVSSPINLLFMTILIEWMFPQGQILLDMSMNQHFLIWTIFGWIIAFLAEKTLICLFYCS